MGERHVVRPLKNYVGDTGRYRSRSKIGLVHQAAARGPTVGRGQIEEDEGAPDTVEVGQRGRKPDG